MVDSANSNFAKSEKILLSFNNVFGNAHNRVFALLQHIYLLFGMNHFFAPYCIGIVFDFLQGFGQFWVDLDLRNGIVIANHNPFAAMAFDKHIGAHIGGGFVAGKAVCRIGAQAAYHFQRAFDGRFGRVGHEFA